MAECATAGVAPAAEALWTTWYTEWLLPFYTVSFCTARGAVVPLQGRLAADVPRTKSLRQPLVAEVGPIIVASRATTQRPSR